jgi:hypothetical protein
LVAKAFFWRKSASFPYGLRLGFWELLTYGFKSIVILSFVPYFLSFFVS